MASALKGVVKVGGYDCEMYYGISEYGACLIENIKVINGENWIEDSNNDERKSPKRILEFAMEQVERRGFGRLKANSDGCHDDIKN